MKEISREPSADSVDANLWDFDVDREKSPAALRHVLLRRPDAHPVWSEYVLSLVHLRPLEGKPAKLQHPDSSHEIVCFALDPESNPDPDDVRSYEVLTPVNLCYQLRGLDDQQALSVFSRFLQALSGRSLSPDTDFYMVQVGMLDRLNEEAKKVN